MISTRLVPTVTAIVASGAGEDVIGRRWWKRRGLLEGDCGNSALHSPSISPMRRAEEFRTREEKISIRQLNNAGK